MRRTVKVVRCASLGHETKGRADNTKLCQHNEIEGCLPQLPHRNKTETSNNKHRERVCGRFNEFF